MPDTTYIPTIGLEIHAELKTRTKMFCDSKNDPDEDRPNVNVCPVCMGHPGTLPTINKQAVKHVLKIGLAVGGTLADFTEFDRKNYFYPDIPKGYQISQYKHPLVSGGSIKGVELTRIHLEEDTGTSIHDRGDYSLVDFNRAGVPLMELVTEPVIHDAKTASDFAKELQLILRYLGAGDANMEKGEMRVEANISVSTDPKKFGTKVEVKNLNSFKSVERAIAFEVDRHIKLLEKGEKIAQETRGFDENLGKTFSQRAKEESHDYRYFPDPDLPKLKLSLIPEFSKEALMQEMPELPEARRTRLRESYGLKAEEADLYIQSPEIGNYFESVGRELKDVELIKLASNYVSSDYMGLLKTSEGSVDKISAKEFAEMIRMTKAGDLSSRGAKDLLKALFEQGGEARVLADKLGLMQKSDTEFVTKIAKEVVAENPEAAAEFKAGKSSSLQFLIGQGMKKSKGAVNPGMLKKAIESII